MFDTSNISSRCYSIIEGITDFFEVHACALYVCYIHACLCGNYLILFNQKQTQKEGEDKILLLLLLVLNLTRSLKEKYILYSSCFFVTWFCFWTNQKTLKFAKSSTIFVFKCKIKEEISI